MDNKTEKNKTFFGKLKLTRRELISLCSAVVSLCLFIGTTIAWYSENQKLDSDGMLTSIEVTPNLVISDSADAIKNANFLSVTANPFSVTFSSGSKTLEPATHSQSAASGLVTVVNTDYIGYNTGLIQDGATLQYADVAVSGSSVNYLDYTVYIASTGLANSGKNLTATLSTTAAVASDSDHNAISVDVIVNGSFSKTLNLVTSRSAVIYTGEIPLNTANSIKVVLRFYYDGALQIPGSSPAKTYVRSDTVDTSNLGTKVYFSID